MEMENKDKILTTKQKKLLRYTKYNKSCYFEPSEELLKHWEKASESISEESKRVSDEVHSQIMKEINIENKLMAYRNFRSWTELNDLMIQKEQQLKCELELLNDYNK
jgi:hypothetical protein